MNRPDSGWGAARISVRFGARQALDQVSVTAHPGQVTAVIGADGAGKTTLLRCVAGALGPGEGTVRRPDARRIGYLPPGPGVYEDLSVAENLRFRSAVYGIPAPAARRTIGEYLEQDRAGRGAGPAGRPAIGRDAPQAGRDRGAAAGA